MIEQMAAKYECKKISRLHFFSEIPSLKIKILFTVSLKELYSKWYLKSQPASVLYIDN